MNADERAAAAERIRALAESPEIREQAAASPPLSASARVELARILLELDDGWRQR